MSRSDPHYLKALHAVNCIGTIPKNDRLFDEMFDRFRAGSGWNHSEDHWRQIHDALSERLGDIHHLVAEVYAKHYTDYELDALIEFHTRDDLSAMRNIQTLVNSECFQRGQEFGLKIARDMPMLAESFAKKKGWLN